MSSEQNNVMWLLSTFYYRKTIKAHANVSKGCRIFGDSRGMVDEWPAKMRDGTSSILVSLINS